MRQFYLLFVAFRNRSNQYKSLGLTTLILLFCFLVAVSLPIPSAMVSIESLTETIEIEVVDDEAARINLPIAWNDIELRCEKYLSLVPKSGAKAQYSRAIGKPLYINLLGNWKVYSNGEFLHQSEEFLSYRIGGKEDECSSPSHIRLPANGKLTTGSENISAPSDETLVSLENTLTIYGRSIDRFLFVFPLNWGPFKPNALYLVEELTLPGGSRVTNAKSTEQASSIWWGIVDISLTDPLGQAMLMKATTNSISVDVFSPSPSKTFGGSGRSSSRQGTAFTQSPDQVSFSLGTRLLQDPNLRWLYAVTTLLIIVYQLSGSVLRRGSPQPPASHTPQQLTNSENQISHNSHGSEESAKHGFSE